MNSKREAGSQKGLQESGAGATVRMGTERVREKVRKESESENIANLVPLLDDVYFQRNKMGRRNGAETEKKMEPCAHRGQASMPLLPRRVSLGPVLICCAAGSAVENGLRPAGGLDATTPGP